MVRSIIPVLKAVLTAGVFIILTGCTSGVKLNSFYTAEDRAPHAKGTTVFVGDATFIDWVYPTKKNLEKLFPGDKDMKDFSYSSMKYHGCVFEFYDNEILRRFLVMVPRNKGFTVNKIKKLYSSRDSVMIKMTYIDNFPEEMWEFPQLKWPAMPVFTLDWIF